jgi:predicted metal-dependent hydrolase
MDKGENIVKYREIGEVRYVKNRRAKHLSIRINPLGEIRVTIPWSVSAKRAEAFLISRKSWIQAKLGEIHQAAEQYRLPEENEVVTIRGKDIPISQQGKEQSGEEALWRILLEEARHYLPERVSYLARIHGFNYTGLKIRRMKSRWGSCTAQNSINLNSWLMMLPEHLSDYIILHELVHTRHRNHSRDFWDTLDQHLQGRSKELRKELRGYRIMGLQTASPA